MVIKSITWLKYITDVLYLSDIDQNLLPIGWLLEKGFKILFEDKWCKIKDVEGKDKFKIKMRGKSLL